VDGLRVIGNRCFDADQIANLVNEWQVDEKGFRLVRTYAGFSFPHGVAVSPSGKWLAVAEYGTNTIALRRRDRGERATPPV
jgi:sugar lactone lactonase YvrE